MNLKHLIFVAGSSALLALARRYWPEEVQKVEKSWRYTKITLVILLILAIGIFAFILYKVWV